MLQVLNARERNQAFIQFILFFSLTTALIVGALYFNFFIVPTQEKEKLSEAVKAYHSESLQQQNFSVKMEEARKYLDSFKTSGNPTVNAMLTRSLTELQKLRKDDDSTANGRLNNAIFLSFLTQQEQILDIADKTKKLTDFKEQLVTCRQQLSDLRTTYGVNPAQ